MHASLAFASAALVLASAQKCFDQATRDPQYNKAAPSAGGAGFRNVVAHPWKSSSCCTDYYTQQLQDYGVEALYNNFSFHHCSIRENRTDLRISPRCLQYLMWEEAFYSCDPYIATLDKDNNGISDRAPICQSFCDDWYSACYNDVSCVRDWYNDWDIINGTYVCPQGSPCKTFGQWYANGSDMCNAMWGDAFSVSSDDSNCINMWFWGQKNPNSYLVAKASAAAGASTGIAAAMVAGLTMVVSLLQGSH